MVHLIAVILTVTLVLAWLYRAKGWWATIAGGIFFLAWNNLFGYWAISYYEIVLAPLYFGIFLLLLNVNEKPSAWKLILVGILVSVGS